MIVLYVCIIKNADMVSINDKRKKKAMLIEKRSTLNCLLQRHVQANLFNIRNTMYMYLNVNIDLPNDWAQNIIIQRLNSWILNAQNILLQKNIKFYVENKELPVKKFTFQKFYKALTVYVLTIEHLRATKEEGKIKEMQLQVNLINGTIIYKNPKNIFTPESNIDKNKYANINFYLIKPLELQFNTLHYNMNLFILQLNNIISTFKYLEQLEESHLCEILFKKHTNLQKLEFDFASNCFLDKLEEIISAYISSLYLQKFTMKKKAILINLLILTIPLMAKRIDISYFNGTAEYYLVYWIEYYLNVK